MTPQFRSTYQQHPCQKCDDTTVQINLPTTTSSPLLQSKLLTTMLPTPEEKHKIQEATICNPYLPLGSAEQFLMMLSSISELPARLKLWIFKLDYENMEKNVRVCSRLCRAYICSGNYLSVRDDWISAVSSEVGFTATLSPGH
ncbi:uncharacterized protein [Cherax quadricarinatus]|uniref:uncharacterized protein isoform X3 n=1 Tax=Cherax quadricarinatus TaxID=27406 RepID=UPI00387EBCDE